MYEKLKKFCLLILFFSFLQSCSGGKIGNFLESSFKNIELSEVDNKSNKVQKNKSNIPKNEFFIKENNKENDQKNNLVKTLKSPKKEDLKENGKLINDEIITEEKIKSQRKNNFQFELNKKKKFFKPQSYRITIILNEVDPSSPLENLSNVLRNSNLNFEIENIQRFPNKENINKKKE